MMQYYIVNHPNNIDKQQKWDDLLYQLYFWFENA